MWCLSDMCLWVRWRGREKKPWIRIMLDQRSRVIGMRERISSKRSIKSKSVWKEKGTLSKKIICQMRLWIVLMAIYKRTRKKLLDWAETRKNKHLFMNPTKWLKGWKMVRKYMRMRVTSMDRTQLSTRIPTKMSLCIERTRSNLLPYRKTRNRLYQHIRCKVKRKWEQRSKATFWTPVLQATHLNPWKQKIMRKIIKVPHWM